MNVLSLAWNTFNETGKYTCATVEYAGLLTYSILRRGGSVLKVGISKVTSPVAAAIGRPFAVIRDRTGVIFISKQYAEKLRVLEEKIMVMEKRMALIEKHGVVPTAGAWTRERRRELDAERQSLLREIFEANVLLREAG